MVIGEASANAQPNIGSDSSSFLATKDSGGKYMCSASVSQVELCFDITMCGGTCSPRGMFSVPIARQRMPQIHRAPHRLRRHQMLMKLKRVRGGSQANSS